jgi:hypothetical protein
MSSIRHRFSALAFTLAIAVVGIALFVAGVGMVGLAGGVPYPDGPDSGHLSKPGFGRFLESTGHVLVMVGAVVAAIGLTCAFAFRVWNIARTTWSRSTTPRQ